MWKNNAYGTATAAMTYTHVLETGLPELAAPPCGIRKSLMLIRIGHLDKSYLDVAIRIPADMSNPVGFPQTSYATPITVFGLP